MIFQKILVFHFCLNFLMSGLIFVVQATYCTVNTENFSSQSLKLEICAHIRFSAIHYPLSSTVQYSLFDLLVLKYTKFLFIGAFAKFGKANISFVVSARLSVHMEQLGSHWTDFHQMWYLSISWNSVENRQELLNSVKSTYKVKIISCRAPPAISNLSTKYCRENQNTSYVQKLVFQNRAVCEIMWKSIAESGRPQMTI